MTRVIIDDRFRATGRKFERAALRGVDKASRAGVAAAQAKPTRYRLGSINAKIRVVPARLMGTKIIGGFVSEDWRQIFFEWGTLTKRTKPLKRPRKRKVSRGGIEPQHTLAFAKRAARQALVQKVAAELARVR